MEERTWRRGQKADYTDRPLTEEEKRFAEEHHDYMYQFMRSYRLAVSGRTRIRHAGHGSAAGQPSV